MPDSPMNGSLARPLVTPADRLSVAVFFAIVCHALLLLGVAFVPEPPPKPRYDTMEIILVNEHSEAPEEAELLAQANLEGGSDNTEEASPATPVATPLPEPAARLASPPAPSAATAARKSLPQKAAPAAHSERPAPEPEAVPDDSPEQLVAETRTAEAAVTAPAPAPAASREIDRGEDEASEASRPAPSASELVASSFAIASLNAEIQERLDARAKRPRRKFISANTREYKYAAYMEAWRAKVERVGNINYPDEARRRGLSGSLILEVIIEPDGSVKETIVRRSSGHKVLDDAAVRIVEMAAPFAPFPDHIVTEVDLLHVTRTWQFLDNAGFRGR